MFYINEKKVFHLKELMETFAISKSTALRDIQELEALGVPLYVENGRYGGYQVLQNTLLPPIYFSEKRSSPFLFLTTIEIIDRFTIWRYLWPATRKIVAYLPKGETAANRDYVGLCAV